MFEPTDSHASRVDLRGQVAVVTGGGRGLGAAYAEALAAAGARVALFARSALELEATAGRIRARGGVALPLTGDTTDLAAVRGAYARLLAELGAPDLVVCAAGLGPPYGPTWQTDPDAWWRTLEVNVRGPHLWAHTVLPRMLDSGRGRIINVSSGSGNAVVPYLSAYVTSKAALTRFTEQLAAEIGSRGVAVFAIGPGAVRTAMTEEALTTDAGRRWIPWFGPYIRDHGVTKEAAAAFVVWLASGALDELTGRFLSQRDDPAELRAHAARIRAADLAVLRLRPPLAE
jgi:NAD(P)-dependent dehydrogenase (short-subunit alcohol dehydrogenase family)